MADQKPKGYTADDLVNLNPDPNGPIIPQSISNPEPIYKANKNIAKNRLFNINSKIDENKINQRNGKLQKVQLKTFGEHYQTLGKNPRDFTEMSPDRLVYVVQTYYPKGFKHPRVGLIKNAQVTGVYDAETGRLVSQSYRRLQ